MLKKTWLMGLSYLLMSIGTVAPYATVQAQTFGAPNCGTVSADSTCFTKATPSTCTAPDQPANQRASCPAGYVGQFNQTGTRNMCTGVVTWNTGGDTSSCTNCGAALTTAETDAVVSAIVAQSESINLAFMDYVFPGFNYKDGANVTNPLTGTVIGRAFRDHVWVSPDAYSSGQLPTTNRMNYLSQQGMVQANFPPSSNLPKDSKGNPITNVAMLYLQSLTSVQASGVTSCTGDGMDGCHVSCTQPGSGWQQQFCHTKTVQFYSCSDSYAVSTGVGTWQPTKSVTVPYTSTSPQNYAQKEWDWGSAFQWNGLDANGGNVFMCNETINGCVGWKSTSSEYKCRTPVTYACSYYDSAAGKTVNTTCSSCDPAQGAFWDYLLTQSNDCPLVPGLSTRASEGETRTVWQSDMGSCPINGGGASGGSVTSCPSNQVLLGTGSCGCPVGSTWDGSMCQTASCPANSSVTSACPSGQTGSIVTTTTYAGASCAETTTVQNTCQVTCPASTSVTSACPSGQTGSIVTTTTYSGASCSATTTVQKNCQGQISGGSCANGATDYPTCTPPTVFNGCCQQAQAYVIESIGGCSITRNGFTTEVASCYQAGWSSYKWVNGTCTEIKQNDDLYFTIQEANTAANNVFTPEASSYNSTNCSCAADGDWHGVFSNNYMTKTGVLLSGVSFVGCGSPNVAGLEGDTYKASCGYVWNGGGSAYPEVPSGPSDPSVTVEGNKTFTCTSGQWK